MTPGRLPPFIVVAMLGIGISWRTAVAQGEAWTASPARPTVGDTVWLTRRVDAPPGWRMRAGKLTPLEDVEPLGDALLTPVAGGWIIRYPMVAWTPGSHSVTLPPIWRLAPDGRTDSIAGGVAGLDVQSVIPDSIRNPEPKSAIDPVRLGRIHLLWPIGAILLVTLLGSAGVWWRRRPRRPLEPAPHVPLEPEVSDSRWLAAGEPKAVAARAAGRLRAVTQGAEQPGGMWARELGEILEQLERIEYGASSDQDVATLATRAKALARGLKA